VGAPGSPRKAPQSNLNSLGYPASESTRFTLLVNHLSHPILRPGMKRILVLSAGSIILFVTTAGCVEQLLTVQSDPPDALVELNGQEMGRTPVTQHFTWYGTYDVILRRENYQTLKTTAKVIAPLYQWVPLDLISELLPIPLKDHHVVHYTLTPVQIVTEPPPGIMDRAIQLKGQLEATHYPTTKSSTTTTSK
jgi:hypothetical protein